MWELIVYSWLSHNKIITKTIDNEKKTIKKKSSDLWRRVEGPKDRHGLDPSIGRVGLVWVGSVRVGLGHEIFNFWWVSFGRVRYPKMPRNNAVYSSSNEQLWHWTKYIFSSMSCEWWKLLIRDCVTVTSNRIGLQAAVLPAVDRQRKHFAIFEQFVFLCLCVAGLLKH